MGSCLSCLLGDANEDEEFVSTPGSLAPSKAKGAPNFLNGPQKPNSKAKIKSDRIDALIEKQATEQNNIVKILLLGKFCGKQNLLF
jgi:hypothetical protein